MYPEVLKYSSVSAPAGELQCRNSATHLACRKFMLLAVNYTRTEAYGGAKRAHQCGITLLLTVGTTCL